MNKTPKEQKHLIEIERQRITELLLNEKNTEAFIQLSRSLNNLKVKLKALEFVADQKKRHLPSHGESVDSNNPAKIIYYGNSAAIKF
jgi:hypothetical protein